MALPVPCRALLHGRNLVGLGRKGAGRSTVARGGSVRLLARERVAERPFRIARAGIAYVPENREVFGQLNVEENLRLPAGALSGGEQQVLVLGRGEAVFHGSAAALRERTDVIDTWVGVA